MTRTAIAAADPPPGPVTAAQLSIGDTVWVLGFGRWRRGVVTRLARIRVRVNYAADRHGGRRERWIAADDRDPVYPGALAEPGQYRCVLPGCGKIRPGRPGQSAEQIRDEHEASATCAGTHGRTTPVPPAQTATPLPPRPPAPPPPEHEVWIAAERRDITAHDPRPTAARWFTFCSRVIRYDDRGPYGVLLPARDAAERHQVQWCTRCWPPGPEHAGG